LANESELFKIKIGVDLTNLEELERRLKVLKESIEDFGNNIIDLRFGNNGKNPTKVSDAKLPPRPVEYSFTQGAPPTARGTPSSAKSVPDPDLRRLSVNIAELNNTIQNNYADKSRHPSVDTARMAAITASTPGAGVSYGKGGMARLSAADVANSKEMYALLEAHKKAQVAVNQESSKILNALKQLLVVHEGVNRYRDDTLPALLSNLTTLQANAEREIKGTRSSVTASRVPPHRAVPMTVEEIQKANQAGRTSTNMSSVEQLARKREEKVANALKRLEEVFTETFTKGKTRGAEVLSRDVVEKLNTGFKVLSSSVETIADTYNQGGTERNKAASSFKEAKLQRVTTPSGDFGGLEFRTLNVEQLRKVVTKHLGTRELDTEFEIARALGDLKKQLKGTFKKEVESAVVSFPVPTLAASDRGAQLVYTGQKGPIRSNPVEFVELRTGIDRLVSAISNMGAYSKERPLAVRTMGRDSERIKTSILKGQVLEPEFEELFKRLNSGEHGEFAKGEIEKALKQAIAYRAGQATAAESAKENVFKRVRDAEIAKLLPAGRTPGALEAIERKARAVAARTGYSETQAGDITRISRAQQAAAKEAANTVLANLNNSNMGLEQLLSLSRELGITGTAIVRHLSVAKGQNIADKMVDVLTTDDGKKAARGTDMSTPIARALLNLVELRNRPQNIPKAQSNFSRPITALLEDVEPFEEQIIASSGDPRRARLRRANQNKRALQQVHITTSADIGRVSRGGGRNSYGLFEHGFSVQTEIEDVLRELNDVLAFGATNENLEGIRNVSGRSLSEEVAAKISEGRNGNEISVKRVRGSVRDLIPYARPTVITRRSEQPLSGIGPDLPYLRTVEGQQAIDMGLIGPSAYNTVTEFRTTPETFEDQKLLRRGSRLARSVTGGVHSLIRDINEQFVGSDGKIINREDALRRVYRTGQAVTSSMGSAAFTIDKKEAASQILDIIESRVKQGSTVDEATVLQILDLFHSQQGKKVSLQTGDKGVVVFKDDLGSQLLPKTPFQSLQYLGHNKKLPNMDRAALKTARAGARGLGNLLYWDENDIKEMEMTLPQYREEGRKTKALNTEELIQKIKETKAAINLVFGQEIKSIEDFRKKVKEVAGEDNEEALYTKRPIDMVTSEAAVARRGLRAEMVAAAATAITGETPLVIGNEDPALLRRVIGKYGKGIGFHAEGDNLPILSEAIGGPGRTDGRHKSLIAKVPVTEFANLRPQEGVESDKFLKFNPNTLAAFKTSFGENSAIFKELSKASEGVSLRFYEMFKVMVAMDAEMARTSPQLDKYREAVVSSAREVNVNDFKRLSPDSFSSAYDLIGSVHDTSKYPETLKIPIPAALRRGSESQLPEYVVIPSAAARGTFQTNTGSVGQDQLGRAITSVVSSLQEYNTGELFPKTALQAGVSSYGSKLKDLIEEAKEDPKKAQEISDEIDRVAKASIGERNKTALKDIIGTNISEAPTPAVRKNMLIHKVSELENYFIRGYRYRDPHEGGSVGHPSVFSEISRLYSNDDTRAQASAQYEQLATIFSDSSNRLGFKGLGFRPGEETNPEVASQVQYGIKGLMDASQQQVFGKGSIFHTGTSELRYPTMMLPITNRQVDISDQLKSVRDLSEKLAGSDMSDFASFGPHLEKLMEESKKVKTTSLETVEMHEDRLKELLNNMVSSGYTDEDTRDKLLAQAKTEGIGSFVTRFPITDFKSFQGRILKTHNEDDNKFSLRIAGGLSKASQEAALDPALIQFKGGRAVGGKLVTARDEISEQRSKLLSMPIGSLTDVDKDKLKDLNLRYTALSKAIQALTNTFHSMSMAADFDGDKFFISLMAGTDAQKELVRSVTKLAKGYEMVNGKPVLVTDFMSELQDQQMSGKGPKIRTSNTSSANAGGIDILDTIDSLFMNEQLPGFFSGRTGKEDEIQAPSYGLMGNLRGPEAKLAVSDAFKQFIKIRGGDGEAPTEYGQEGRMAIGEKALRSSLEKVGVSLPSRPIVLGSLEGEETQKNLDAMASEAVDQLEAKSTILKLAGPKLLTGAVTESTNTVVRLLEAENKRALANISKRHSIGIDSKEQEALSDEFKTREGAFQHSSAGVIQEALSTKFGNIPVALKLLNALNAPAHSEDSGGEMSFNDFMSSIKEGGGFESLNEPARANKAARISELSKLTPEKLQQRLLAFARIREEMAPGSTVNLRDAGGGFKEYSAKQIEQGIEDAKKNEGIFAGKSGITGAGIIDTMSSEYSPREIVKLMRSTLERNTISSVSDKMQSREWQLRRGGKTEREARGEILEQIAKVFGFLKDFKPDLPGMASKFSKLDVGGIHDLSTASIREIVAAAVRIKGPRVFETVAPVRQFANKGIDRLREMLGYIGGDEESAGKAALSGGVTASFLKSIVRAINPDFVTADTGAVQLSHKEAEKYLSEYDDKVSSLRKRVLSRQDKHAEAYGLLSGSKEGEEVEIEPPESVKELDKEIALMFQRVQLPSKSNLGTLSQPTFFAREKFIRSVKASSALQEHKDALLSKFDMSDNEFLGLDSLPNEGLENFSGDTDVTTSYKELQTEFKKDRNRRLIREKKHLQLLLKKRSLIGTLDDVPEGHEPQEWVEEERKNNERAISRSKLRIGTVYNAVRLEKIKELDALGKGGANSLQLMRLMSQAGGVTDTDTEEIKKAEAIKAASTGGPSIPGASSVAVTGGGSSSGLMSDAQFKALVELQSKMLQILTESQHTLVRLVEATNRQRARGGYDYEKAEVSGAGSRKFSNFDRASIDALNTLGIVPEEKEVEDFFKSLVEKGSNRGKMYLSPSMVATAAAAGDNLSLSTFRSSKGILGVDKKGIPAKVRESLGFEPEKSDPAILGTAVGRAYVAFAAEFKGDRENLEKARARGLAVLRESIESEHPQKGTVELHHMAETMYDKSIETEDRRKLAEEAIGSELSLKTGGVAAGSVPYSIGGKADIMTTEVSPATGMNLLGLYDVKTSKELKGEADPAALLSGKNNKFRNQLMPYGLALYELKKRLKGKSDEEIDTAVRSQVESMRPRDEGQDRPANQEDKDLFKPDRLIAGIKDYVKGNRELALGIAPLDLPAQSVVVTDDKFEAYKAELEANIIKWQQFIERALQRLSEGDISNVGLSTARGRQEGGYGREVGSYRRLGVFTPDLTQGGMEFLAHSGISGSDNDLKIQQYMNMHKILRAYGAKAVEDPNRYLFSEENTDIYGQFAGGVPKLNEKAFPTIAEALRGNKLVTYGKFDPSKLLGKIDDMDDEEKMKLVSTLAHEGGHLALSKSFGGGYGEGQLGSSMLDRVLEDKDKGMLGLLTDQARKVISTNAISPRVQSELGFEEGDVGRTKMNKALLEGVSQFASEGKVVPLDTNVAEEKVASVYKNVLMTALEELLVGVMVRTSIGVSAPNLGPLRNFNDPRILASLQKMAQRAASPSAPDSDYAKFSSGKRGSSEYPISTRLGISKEALASMSDAELESLLVSAPSASSAGYTARRLPSIEKALSGSGTFTMRLGELSGAGARGKELDKNDKNRAYTSNQGKLRRVMGLIEGLGTPQSQREGLEFQTVGTKKHLRWLEMIEKQAERYGHTFSRTEEDGIVSISVGRGSGVSASATRLPSEIDKDIAKRDKYFRRPSILTRRERFSRDRRAANSYATLESRLATLKDERERARIETPFSSPSADVLRLTGGSGGGDSDFDPGLFDFIGGIFEQNATPEEAAARHGTVPVEVQDRKKISHEDSLEKIVNSPVIKTLRQKHGLFRTTFGEKFGPVPTYFDFSETKGFDENSALFKLLSGARAGLTPSEDTKKELLAALGELHETAKKAQTGVVGREELHKSLKKAMDIGDRIAGGKEGSALSKINPTSFWAEYYDLAYQSDTANLEKTQKVAQELQAKPIKERDTTWTSQVESVERDYERLTRSIGEHMGRKFATRQSFPYAPRGRGRGLEGGYIGLEEGIADIPGFTDAFNRAKRDEASREPNNAVVLRAAQIGAGTIMSDAPPSVRLNEILTPLLDPSNRPFFSDYLRDTIATTRGIFDTRMKAGKTSEKERRDQTLIEATLKKLYAGVEKSSMGSLVMSEEHADIVASGFMKEVAAMQKRNPKFNPGEYLFGKGYKGRVGRTEIREMLLNLPDEIPHENMAMLAPGFQEKLQRENLGRLRLRVYASDYLGKKFPGIREHYADSLHAFEPGTSIGQNQKITDSSGRIIQTRNTIIRPRGPDPELSFRDISEKVENNAPSSNQTLSNAFKRVALWGTASGVVYGLIRAIGSMAQVIKQTEVNMIELQKVMNPATTDFGKLRDSAVGFAKEFGTSVNTVLDSFVVFAKQGLGQSEVLERGRTSVLAGNVTEGMKPEKATEILTSALKQFPEEGGDALRFLDSLNEVANRFAVTETDLGDSLLRAGASAKVAGVSFDEFLGLTTALVEVTRKTGRETGTSLNYMLRSLYRPKSRQALAEIGIPVVDAKGLRTATDILKDLSTVFDSLSAEQKLNVVEATVGTRRYNDFAVILHNFDTALSATTISANSQGSAMRENQLVMESYAKKVEVLKASTDALAIKFGDVLLPVAKAVVATMTGMVHIFTEIPNSVKIATAAAASLLIVLGKIQEIKGMTGDLLGGASPLKLFSNLKIGLATGLEKVIPMLTSNTKLLGGTVAALALLFTDVGDAAKKTFSNLKDDIDSLLDSKLKIGLTGESTEKKLNLSIFKEEDTSSRSASASARLAKTGQAFLKSYNLEKAGPEGTAEALSKISEGTFESPLAIRKKALIEQQSIINEVARINLDLVDSYDKQGNAILKTNNLLSIQLDLVKSLSDTAIAFSKIKIAEGFANDLGNLSNNWDIMRQRFKELLSHFGAGGRYLEKQIDTKPINALNYYTNRMEVLTDKRKTGDKSVDPEMRELQTKIAEAQTDVDTILNRIYENLIPASKNLAPSDVLTKLSSDANKNALTEFSRRELAKEGALTGSAYDKINAVDTRAKENLAALVFSQFGIPTRGTTSGRGIAEKYMEAGLTPKGISEGRAAPSNRDVITFSDEIADKLRVAAKFAVYIGDRFQTLGNDNEIKSFTTDQFNEAMSSVADNAQSKFVMMFSNVARDTETLFEAAVKEARRISTGAGFGISFPGDINTGARLEKELEPQLRLYRTFGNNLINIRGEDAGGKRENFLDIVRKQQETLKSRKEALGLTKEGGRNSQFDSEEVDNLVKISGASRKAVTDLQETLANNSAIITFSQEIQSLGDVLNNVADSIRERRELLQFKEFDERNYLTGGRNRPPIDLGTRRINLSPFERQVQGGGGITSLVDTFNETKALVSDFSSAGQNAVKSKLLVQNIIRDFTKAGISPDTKSLEEVGAAAKSGNLGQYENKELALKSIEVNKDIFTESARTNEILEIIAKNTVEGFTEKDKDARVKSLQSKLPQTFQAVDKAAKEGDFSTLTSIISNVFTSGGIPEKTKLAIRDAIIERTREVGDRTIQEAPLEITQGRNMKDALESKLADLAALTPGGDKTTDPIKFRANLGEFEKLTLAILDNIISSTKAQASELASSGDRLTTILDGLKATIDAVLGAVEGGFNSILSTFNQLSTVVATPSIGVGELAGFKNVNPSIDLRRRKEDLSPEERLFSSRQEDVFSVNILNSALQESGTMLTGLKDKLVQFSKEGRSQAERNVLSNTIRDIQSAREDMTDQLKILADSLSKGLDIQKMISSLESLRKQLDTFKIDKDNLYSKASYDTAQGLQPRQLLDGTNGQKYFGSAGLTASQQEVERTQKKHPSIIDDRNASLAKEAADEARRLKENQEELARQQSVGEEARKVAIEGVRLNVPGSKALLNDINAELAGSGRIVGEKNHVPEFAGIDLEGSAIDRGIRSLTLELEKTKANTNAEAIAGKLGGTFKDLFSNFILAEDALFQRSDSVAIANTDRMVDILQQIVKNANNSMAGGVIPSGGTTGGVAGGASSGVPGAVGTIFASNGGPMYTGAGGRYYNTSGYQIASEGVKAAGIGIAGSLPSSTSPSSSAFNIPDMLSPESALIDGIYDIKGPVLPPSTVNSSNPLASKAFTMPSFSSGVDVTTAGLTNDLARTVPLMGDFNTISARRAAAEAARAAAKVKNVITPEAAYAMKRAYYVSRKGRDYSKFPEFVPTEAGITTPTNPVGPKVRESIPKLNGYLEEVRDAFFPKPDPNLNWPENVYTAAAREGRTGAAIAREAAAPLEEAAPKLGFFRRMGRYMSAGADSVGGLAKNIPGGALSKAVVPMGIAVGASDVYTDYRGSRQAGSTRTMATYDAFMGPRRRTDDVPTLSYITNTASNVLRPSSSGMFIGGFLGGLAGIPGGPPGIVAGAATGAAWGGAGGLALGAAGEITNQRFSSKDKDNPLRDSVEYFTSPLSYYFRGANRRRNALNEEVKTIQESIDAGQTGPDIEKRLEEALKKKKASEDIVSLAPDVMSGKGIPRDLFNKLLESDKILGPPPKYKDSISPSPIFVKWEKFNEAFSDNKKETAIDDKQVQRGFKDIRDRFTKELDRIRRNRESSGPFTDVELKEARDSAMSSYANSYTSNFLKSVDNPDNETSLSSNFAAREKFAKSFAGHSETLRNYGTDKYDKNKLNASLTNFPSTPNFPEPKPSPYSSGYSSDIMPLIPSPVSGSGLDTFKKVQEAFKELEKAAESSGVTLQDISDRKFYGFKSQLYTIATTLKDLQRLTPGATVREYKGNILQPHEFDTSTSSMARPILESVRTGEVTVENEEAMKNLLKTIEAVKTQLNTKRREGYVEPEPEERLKEKADKAVKSAADAVSLDTSTMSLVPSPDKSTIKDGTSIVGGPRKGTGGGLEALKGLYSSEGFNPDQIGNKLNNFFDNLILELRNKNVSDETLKKLSPDMSFPSIINTVREDAQGANLFGAANASLLSGNRQTGSYFEDIMLANDRARRPAIGLSNTTGANNTLSIMNEANGTSYGLQRYGAVARRDPEIDKMAYTVNIPSKKLSKETENAYFTGNVDVETRNRQLAALGKLSEGGDSPFAGLGLSGSGQLVTRTPSDIMVEDRFNLGEIYGNNDFQKAKVGQATFGLLQSDGTKLPTPIDPFGMKGALATSVANSTALQPSVQALVRSVGPSGISPTSAFGDTVTGTNLANNGVIAAFAAGTTGKAKDDYTKNIDTVKAFGLDKTFEQLGGTFKYSGGGQKAFLGGKEISAENFAKFTQHGLDSEAAKPLADLLGVKAAGLDGKTSTDKEAEGATTADGKKAQAPELTVSKIIVQTEITTPAIKAGSLQISGDESKKSNTASAAGADEILISSITESVIQKLEMPNIKEQVASAVQIANDATNKISAVADRVRAVTGVANAANATAASADRKAEAALAAARANNYKPSPPP